MGGVGFEPTRITERIYSPSLSTTQPPLPYNYIKLYLTKSLELTTKITALNLKSKSEKIAEIRTGDEKLRLLSKAEIVKKTKNTSVKYLKKWYL